MSDLKDEEINPSTLKKGSQVKDVLPGGEVWTPSKTDSNPSIIFNFTETRQLREVQLARLTNVITYSVSVQFTNYELPPQVKTKILSEYTFITLCICLFIISSTINFSQ